MSYFPGSKAIGAVLVPIRIEAATGAIVTDRFIIDRDMRLRDLKRIDPDVFEVMHAYRNFLSCVVARAAWDEWRITIGATLIDFEICRLDLSAWREGDSWETFTAAKDAEAKRLLYRILEGSDLHQNFHAEWGTVAIEFENRNC